MNNNVINEYIEKVLEEIKNSNAETVLDYEVYNKVQEHIFCTKDSFQKAFREVAPRFGRIDLWSSAYFLTSQEQNSDMIFHVRFNKE